jgi:DNA-binding response OmpR family regulator
MLRPEAAVGPQDRMNPEKRNSTVLIVDDERVITDTLAMVLAQSGYHCSVAYDGWAGLARAREVKPDMVISGVINGGGPNGLEMAVQILDEMPDTRILLFSGPGGICGPSGGRRRVGP